MNCIDINTLNSKDACYRHKLLEKISKLGHIIVVGPTLHVFFFMVLGQTPRRTKAPKDRGPAILAARTEAPRFKRNIYLYIYVLNKMIFFFF